MWSCFDNASISLSKKRIQPQDFGILLIQIKVGFIDNSNVSLSHCSRAVAAWTGAGLPSRYFSRCNKSPTFSDKIQVFRGGLPAPGADRKHCRNKYWLFDNKNRVNRSIWTPLGLRGADGTLCVPSKRHVFIYSPGFSKKGNKRFVSSGWYEKVKWRATCEALQGPAMAPLTVFIKDTEMFFSLTG